MCSSNTKNFYSEMSTNSDKIKIFNEYHKNMPECELSGKKNYSKIAAELLLFWALKDLSWKEISLMEHMERCSIFKYEEDTKVHNETKMREETKVQCTDEFSNDSGPRVKRSKVSCNNFNENDINLVIDQSHCSREEAISALINNDGDLVNAIMELTI